MNAAERSGAEDINKNSDEELGDAEKNIVTGVVEPVNPQHGRLQEIEVDLGHVVEDREIKDIEGDTSPYPEVVSDEC